MSTWYIYMCVYVASPFSFVLISSSLTSHSLNMQENKCKVLEIILHDLKGNHCEIIAFVCLWMFSRVWL
jgi:hypothetical protein